MCLSHAPEYENVLTRLVENDEHCFSNFDSVDHVRRVTPKNPVEKRVVENWLFCNGFL